MPKDLSDEAARYEPQPIDTTQVELSGDLLELMERLAEHVHDLWALQRLREGWSYGPARDDEAKRHPCLVPYASLPESEKDIDRTTAAETLKAIVALGYEIRKRDESRAAAS